MAVTFALPGDVYKRQPFANVISDSTYPTEGIPHPRLYGTFPRVIQKSVSYTHLDVYKRQQ